MPPVLELFADTNVKGTPLFATDEDYAKFRQEFMDEVIPQQEKWQEARRRSEEESRQRLLK